MGGLESIFWNDFGDDFGEKFGDELRFLCLQEKTHDFDAFPAIFQVFLRIIGGAREENFDSQQGL